MKSPRMNAEREDSPQADPRPHTRPWQKGGPRLAFESILIVLSVLLALAVTSWGERRADRELAAAALTNFRSEIEANLRELERLQPTHAGFAERLGEAAGQPSSAASIAAFDEYRRVR